MIFFGRVSGMTVFAMFALVSAVAFAQGDAGANGDLRWQSQPVSAWVAVLDSAFSDDPAPLTRQWYAAYALGQYGEKAKPAVPAMLERLKTAFDRDNYVRAAVARSLGMIGSTQAVTVMVSVMEQAIQQGEDSIPRNTAWALGEFGPAVAGGEAVPALEALLTHDDVQTRAAAAVALWQIARHEAALKTLIAMLNTRKANEIYEGAMGISRIGPSLGGKASAVIPPLVTWLCSSYADIPQACLEALCAVGEPAIPAVKSALTKTTEPAARARLIAVLGTLAAPANSGFLLELADDSGEAEAVRIAAVRAIPRFPAGQRDAARDVLVRVINDTTSPPGLVREAAELMKTL